MVRHHRSRSAFSVELEDRRIVQHATISLTSVSKGRRDLDAYNSFRIRQPSQNHRPVVHPLPFGECSRYSNTRRVRLRKLSIQSWRSRVPDLWGATMWDATSGRWHRKEIRGRRSDSRDLGSYGSGPCRWGFEYIVNAETFSVFDDPSIAREDGLVVTLDVSAQQAVRDVVSLCLAPPIVIYASAPYIYLEGVMGK